MTEGFIAVLFVWALIGGDYLEASVMALRWIVLAWRLHRQSAATERV